MRTRTDRRFTRGLASAAAALALFAPAASPAAADESVLRHLTFAVNAGVAHSLEQTRAAGSSTGATDAAPSIVMTGGTSTNTTQTIVKGTVVLDVLGLLPSDDALAIRIAESGDKTIPPVRIDVAGDGRIVAAPADRGKLTAEELEIAGLCARGLLGGHDLAAGQVWNVDAGGDKANFRVLSVGADGLAALVVERTAQGRGAGAGDTRSTIHITYDTKRSVPVAATIARRSHLGTLGELRTIDESFEYRLTADSFAPPRG